MRFEIPSYRLDGNRAQELLSGLEQIALVDHQEVRVRPDSSIEEILRLDRPATIDSDKEIKLANDLLDKYGIKINYQADQLNNLLSTLGIEISDAMRRASIGNENKHCKVPFSVDVVDVMINGLTLNVTGRLNPLKVSPNCILKNQ